MPFYTVTVEVDIEAATSEAAEAEVTKALDLMSDTPVIEMRVTEVVGDDMRLSDDA